MTGPAWLACLAAAAAAAAASLLLPHRAPPRRPDPGPAAAGPDDGWLRRHRLLWTALAGVAGATFVHGTAGVVAGAGAAGMVWVVVGRSEPPAERRRRAEVRRDLPAVVALLGAALRSGSGPADGVGLVAHALPGAAADRLVAVGARLALGVSPAQVWADLATDPELAPLGRTLARAHETGAPVVEAVARLADELAGRARGHAEDRARQVGVKAAVPLGLCLLPAFVLVGVVPVVAGLLATVTG
ncbi:type II secretion system F family protein [Nocardioides litoris]|uniref:type II secretion system F family protein n=1 Tax=Nocardioides litoris TaxID=1926648 RepID=UPI001FE7F5F2|nr:type II secretion system F family protein [Nocardioides litoris]